MLRGLEIYERNKFPPGASGQLVEEPLPWDDAIDRMALPASVPNSELLIISKGKIYPFDHPMAPRWRRSWASKVLFGEATGRSRAFKTLSLRAAKRDLSSVGVGIEVCRERPPGLIADFDPVHYNYAMALGTSAALNDAYQAYQRGGYYKRIPNFWIADRGPSSAFMFNNIYRKYGAGDELVEQLTKRHIRDLWFILHFDVPTEVAIHRGSRMTLQMHDEIGRQHNKLPDMIATISKDTDHPIVIAKIDANRPLRVVKQATLQTLSAITEGMLYN